MMEALQSSNQLISLDNTAMDLTVDNPQQLTATTIPTGAEVVWHQVTLQ